MAFKNDKTSGNCKCVSVCACVCVCVFVCGGWSCVEWQGHASWATWIYLGQTRGAYVCLGSGASEPRTEGAFSQLTPELLPAWDQPFSLLLAPSTQPLISLSFTTLCILATSLLGHGLAYFYLCHSGPFDVDYVGPFHRSYVCLQMAPLLNSQSVYEYTFHKQDM